MIKHAQRNLTFALIATLIVFANPTNTWAGGGNVVGITTPSDGGTIPDSPGSTGISGSYDLTSGSGTVFVSIFAADASGNQTGNALSTGSTSVSAGSGTWSVTLNSPAASGSSYVIKAQLKNSSGVVLSTTVINVTGQ